MEHELSKILSVYNVKSFCNCLISSVRIATSDRSDIHDPDMDQKVSAVASEDCHTRLMVKEVVRLFNTSIDMVKATLEPMTQYGIRTAIHPMMHQLHVDHLNLHQPRLAGMWSLDTLMAKVKSKQGNTCANVYTQGKFMKVIPMTLRKDAGKSLIKFTDDVRIPDFLVTDGAMEFTGRNTKFVKEVQCMHIHLHTTTQGQKNQNHTAECKIGMLAKCWKLQMTKKNVTKCFWDFGLVYKAEIMLRMVHRSNNHTGYEQATGQMPNISKWLDFEFYDLVWWLDCPMRPDVTDYM